MAADQLLVHGHVLTMARETGVGHVADGAIAISATRIAEVGPTAAVLAPYPPVERIDARGCAVLAGFIDAHIHTTLAIMRGVAQRQAALLGARVAADPSHRDMVLRRPMAGDLL